MRIVRSIAAMTVAATLAVSVPVSSANAAVRASQAVPTAAAPAKSAGLAGFGWPVWAIAGLTAVMAVFVATKSGGKAEIPLSRG